MKVKVADTDIEVEQLAALPPVVPASYVQAAGGKADALMVPTRYNGVVSSLGRIGQYIMARFGPVVKGDDQGQLRVREAASGYHFVSAHAEDMRRNALDADINPGAERYAWFKDATDPGIPPGAGLAVWYGFRKPNI